VCKFQPLEDPFFHDQALRHALLYRSYILGGGGGGGGSYQKRSRKFSFLPSFLLFFVFNGFFFTFFLRLIGSRIQFFYF
jgi:hypothetical protein